MSSTTKRYGAAMLVLTTVFTGAALYAAQDSSGRTSRADRRQGPGEPGDRRGFGGPAGPGRFGGPGGRESHGAMRRGGMFGPAALDRLNATPAQREQIQAVAQSHRSARESLRARSLAARNALRAAVNATPLDEGSIRAKSADVAAVQADGVVLHARMRSEIFQLLTPEQRTQAVDLSAHPRGRRGGPPAF